MSLASLTGLVILIVEDEFMIALDLEDSIGEAGGHVLGTAQSVTKALALIAGASKLDAAVLDLNLADGVVYPVADALLAAAIPFIFATGAEDSDIPERFGAVTRIAKPASPNAMIAAISLCVKSAGGLQQS